MSDSYVTPSRRNNENRVYSFKSVRDSCEPELDLEKEYFPSLGNNSNVNVESSDENMISFASSLTTEIPKKKGYQGNRRWMDVY